MNKCTYVTRKLYEHKSPCTQLQIIRSKVEPKRIYPGIPNATSKKAVRNVLTTLNSQKSATNAVKGKARDENRDRSGVKWGDNEPAPKKTDSANRFEGGVLAI